MTDRARVIGALGTVYDPELDEPITSLDFVTSCEVSPDGDVEVRLRLPTSQCAPNFAYLMAADARTAVRRLPEVREVTVLLEDHFTEDEINGAVARGESFERAFPGETEDELDALRLLFRRKALVARQSAVCEELVAGGATLEQIAALRIADLAGFAGLAHGPQWRRCLALREHLAIAVAPDARAIVTPDGEPIGAADLPRWLRMARLVRTSLEANGGICRSLLQNRYGLPDSEEVAA